MALQAAGADLWALQILQDADGSSFTLGGAAEAFDVLGMFFVRAVGEIHAGDIHAEAEQVAHRGLGVAGGTDGAYDLGATHGRLRGGIVFCNGAFLAGAQVFLGSRKMRQGIEIGK